MKKSKVFLVTIVVTLSLGFYGCFNPWANKDTNNVDPAANSFSLYDN